MKVTLLTTYKSGGAGIACQRLAAALRKENIDARILMQDRVPLDSNLYSTTYSRLGELRNKVRLAKELFPFILQEKSKHDRFKFSLGREGIDVSTHPVVLDSDIIHLHWINQAFLSLESLTRLAALKKPIVWTLHDMWAFTGGCHYSGQCHRYEQACGNCPYLNTGSASDLSHQTWKRKSSVFDHVKMTFVTCSDWLKSAAERSSLLANFKVESIPNPIDITFFTPIEKQLARKQFLLPVQTKIILFGAMNLNDERKGYAYLLEALNILAEKHPNVCNDIEIVVFGKSIGEKSLPFKIIDLGVLNADSVKDVYVAADVFVLPSLEDNLPNTIMESMACGTPAVGFRTGGIPEMIDHLVNGYIAEYKSAEDLANGIYYVLYGSEHRKLREEARKKVIEHYSQKIVAQRYINLYKQLF